MDHLSEKMSRSSRRGIAYLAVGKVAIAVERAFVPYLVSNYIDTSIVSYTVIIRIHL